MFHCELLGNIFARNHRNQWMYMYVFSDLKCSILIQTRILDKAFPIVYILTILLPELEYDFEICLVNFHMLIAKLLTDKLSNLVNSLV